MRQKKHRFFSKNRLFKFRFDESQGDLPQNDHAAENQRHKIKAQNHKKLELLLVSKIFGGKLEV